MAVAGMVCLHSLGNFLPFLVFCPRRGHLTKNHGESGEARCFLHGLPWSTALSSPVWISTISASMSVWPLNLKRIRSCHRGRYPRR
ncbi:hypothetical protein BCR44DRAFT_1434804 [Catenaria anguillulae PL171]|uniref:Uncharacterized protein n=1 Tax=Catenaria anguillulae PL171 TaxID=765915 RepID=A0A1Y2HQC7_9FUNG|nr:hypothetical protein BCR44DRAFT_1434804 [Catenaria anguillulae PL171]